MASPRDFSSAANSSKFLTGLEALTHSTSGTAATREMGAKSASGS